MNQNLLNNYINAGNIHKNVEEYIKPLLKENMKLIDICNLIENKIKQLSNEKNLNNGIAFPTGISNNNIVAHYTPNYNDTTTLKTSDVCKIDFGVHIDGCIVDSAFTINLDNSYNNLLNASKDAVDNIIKNIGIDSKFSELSAISKEIVESYEINGKHLTPINNICGHNILPYKIHGGKLLYGVPQENDTQIVEENDIMAIEIFSSSGLGNSVLDNNPKNYSHFMLKENYDKSNIYSLSKKSRNLLSIIDNNFNTLPFCPRFIDNINNNHINYSKNYKELFEKKILNIYPPLLEEKMDSKVAQFETCIYIGSNSNIILS